ncbi:unnamed protein product [Cylicocyclus nassatus]|uniref:ABC1 atypical kinase-like domain-containing protein n=1 Tax=Cylicocyclus nassatus TaxID=53992 RepID=A0AA36GWK7_CYLNA|nr:unnamed protein product [Cylicocyclus nassatus]
MPVKASTSTLKWVREEGAPILTGLRLLVQSQLGYEGRKVTENLSQNVLKTVVGAGASVGDPSHPRQTSAFSFVGDTVTDAVQRTSAVAAGIRTYADLLLKGITPGTGGHTVSPGGEKTFGFKNSGLSFDVISGLGKVAELISKGAIQLPSHPLPTLQKLGQESMEEPMFKETDFTNQKYLRQEDNSDEAQALEGLTAEEREFLMKAAQSVEEVDPIVETPPPVDADLGIPPPKPKGAAVIPPKKDANVMPPTPGRMSAHEGVWSVHRESGATMGFPPRVDAPRKTPAKVRMTREVTQKAKERVYRPSLPSDYKVEAEDLAESLSKSKERKVPSSRLGRLASFGQLALGLAGGAAAEVTRRTFGSPKVEGMPSNPFLSNANADRIVQTLCRVRGAALKLGQMLSIQDPDTIPPHLLEIFERVRHSADFMPLNQVERQMVTSFGTDWRSKFATFEDRPFAAASIGQVHKATLPDGRKVAVKIQYPGVAEGIDSDIDNMVSVLSIANVFPKGMYLDKFVEVIRKELAMECDYLREARATKKFRELLAGSKDFYIPEVMDDFTTNRVLTAEFVSGKPVDKCLNEPQVVRDYIAAKFIELCLHEIFIWRFMQTDPNWSNFFLGVHPSTGEPRMVLLDFGASRSYRKKFVDRYMKVIKAASDGDKQKIIDYSKEIGFLTGYETEVMKRAHVESVLILGETLANSKPYDFSRQNITKRVHALIPIMLEHRLTSPPEEIYSLHRKLSGSYLLATKLKAVVSCGAFFDEIFSEGKFGRSGVGR